MAAKVKYGYHYFNQTPYCYVFHIVARTSELGRALLRWNAGGTVSVTSQTCSTTMLPEQQTDAHDVPHGR